VRGINPDCNKEQIMTVLYSIDGDNNIAVHPNKGEAIKEAGEAGTTFATEERLSQATASWPASNLVDVWNGFAGAPPFAELKEVKKFTNHKIAAMRIWNAVQRLASALEQEKPVEVSPTPAPAKQEKPAKAAKPAKVARTAAPKAPAKTKATKETTKKDAAAAPKQREGTRLATVVALLERDGGATMDEIIAATSWQKHTVRGFISTLASKHGFNVTSARREADKARVYAIAK
jgi:hypothetical protein